jgi:hypothetical protein
MGAEGELVSVEKDLTSLKNRIEDRLQSVRNQLDKDTNCHVKTCHEKKYKNDKCEGHYLRDKHASRLYDKYDKPIASLAVQLMEFNVEEWIPDKDGTIGADHIRETGLTRTQRKWLGQLNAKTEDQLDKMIEDVESAKEKDRECPICERLPEYCTCDTALGEVIVKGIDGGVEDDE